MIVKSGRILSWASAGNGCVEMLIDINEFWAHDHRKSLVWKEKEEAENWGGQGGQQGEEEELPSI